MRKKKPVKHFAPHVTEARELARKMLRPTIDEVSRKLARRFGADLFAVQQHVGAVADDELVAHIVRALEEGTDHWEEYAAEQGRSENDALALVAHAYAQVARKRKTKRNNRRNGE